MSEHPAFTQPEYSEGANPHASADDRPGSVVAAEAAEKAEKAKAKKAAAKDEGEDKGGPGGASSVGGHQSAGGKAGGKA
jgi:hypothetical protein